MFEDDDERTYLVVRNDKGQFSIWPADRDLPAGWTAEGTNGPKADCLHHIDQVWTNLRPLPGNGLPGLFTEQAARRPDSVAVLDADTALTYRDLDERSTRLAAHIRARVPKQGARVGLFLHRGHTVPVAILAVLKAGCAYVPLDPAYPADRVRYMAADAGLALLITDADAEPVVPACRRWHWRTRCGRPNRPRSHRRRSRRTSPPTSSTRPGPVAGPRVSRCHTATCWRCSPPATACST